MFVKNQELSQIKTAILTTKYAKDQDKVMLFGETTSAVACRMKQNGFSP